MSIASKILGKQTTQPKTNLTTPPQSGPDSGYAADVADSITAKSQNPYVPGPCNENSQSNANQLPTVTLTIPAVAGQLNFFDNLVLLPRATKKIKICSFAQDQTSDYRYFAMSLLKTGLDEPATEYTIEGTEPWIPLPFNEAFLVGTEIEFEYPVTQFYFHVMGGTSNILTQITFMCADGLTVRMPTQQVQNGG